MTFKFGISELDPGQEPDEKSASQSANQSLRDVVYGVPPKTKGLDESGGVPKPAFRPGSVKESMSLYKSEVSKKSADSEIDSNAKSDSSKLVKGKSEADDTATLLTKQFNMSCKMGNETYIYNKMPWCGRPPVQGNIPMIGALTAKSPRAAGVITMVLGTGSMSYDVHDFLNANTSREQIKYGTATFADAEILTGGALMLMRKCPKAGPALVGIGLTARLLIDMLPNDVQR